MRTEHGYDDIAGDLLGGDEVYDKLSTTEFIKAMEESKAKSNLKGTTKEIISNKIENWFKNKLGNIEYCIEKILNNENEDEIVDSDRYKKYQNTKERLLKFNKNIKPITRI